MANSNIGANRGVFIEGPPQLITLRAAQPWGRGWGVCEHGQGAGLRAFLRQGWVDIPDLAANHGGKKPCMQAWRPHTGDAHCLFGAATTDKGAIVS